MDKLKDSERKKATTKKKDFERKKKKKRKCDFCCKKIPLSMQNIKCRCGKRVCSLCFDHQCNFNYQKNNAQMTTENAMFIKVHQI